MRRWLLLACLGLAAGGSTAWGQTPPAATRTARLGLPIVATEAPSPEVAPAGLQLTPPALTPPAGGAVAAPANHAATIPPMYVLPLNAGPAAYSPVAVPTATVPSSEFPPPTVPAAAVPVTTVPSPTLPSVTLPATAYPVVVGSATAVPAAPLTVAEGWVMPGTPIGGVLPGGASPHPLMPTATPATGGSVVPSVLPPSAAGSASAPSARYGPYLVNGTVNNPVHGTVNTAAPPAAPASLLPPPTRLPIGTIPQAPPTGAAPNGAAPSVTEIRTPSGGTPATPGNGMTGSWVAWPDLETPLFGPLPGLDAVHRLTAPSKYWASAEFLMWWNKSADLPPLITTSSPIFQGIPGLGDTRTLLGGNWGNTLHAGGRFSVGRWFGDDQIRGVEGRIFFLGRTDSTFAATSGEYPLLARPFFNVNVPQGPFSEIIAAPGRGLGSVVVTLQNDNWGADVNYRRLLWRSGCARLEALAGYRYFGMKERLDITESFVVQGNNGPRINGQPVIAGSVTDVFRAENHFHGGQIGLLWEHRWGRWTFDARASVAFGGVVQLGEIDGGQTLVLANGTISRFAGGLLALPNANIGRYEHSQFAVLPEVGVNIGYQLTPHMRLYFGYNFLYLGNALRPERMIDTSVDIARIPNFSVPGGGTTPVPGLPRPAPLFRTNDYFVQGINFGLEFRW